MVILKVQNLVKRYNGRAVVDHVSFHVRQGEIVGLLGRNGAGKTTSFRMAMGMITPEGGQVVFEGHDVSRMPMYKRSRLGMGYLSQEPSIFRNLTVEENLLLILENMGYERQRRIERCRQLLESAGIDRLAHQKARLLSGGEKRRLEICRSLATNPHFILLDEPFSGVDPIAVNDIQNIIIGLRDQGIGILITDHSVRETLEVTNRSYILHEGDVLVQGRPTELVNDPIVRQTYLGDRFYFRTDEGL